MKILIVEDNIKIATQLADHLKHSGFVTHIENDGESGHFEGSAGGYDLAILDIGLSGMDGFSILEKWRAEGVSMPVIIVTARDSKMDVIRGLEIGADDYITKPFDLDEVVARINSNIKRSLEKNKNILISENVEFDLRLKRVLVDGIATKLTRIEFLIVQYLFMNQGKPVSINELTEHTYEDFDNDSSVIVRHIANIRKKIGNNFIKTEANRGYYVS